MKWQQYLVPILVFYPLIQITTEWRWWLADIVMWQAEPLFDWSGVEYKTLAEMAQIVHLCSIWDTNILYLKLNKINMDNFHLLEDVGRGSETQQQVVGYLNYLIWRFSGQLKAVECTTC